MMRHSYLFTALLAVLLVTPADAAMRYFKGGIGESITREGITLQVVQSAQRDPQTEPDGDRTYQYLFQIIITNNSGRWLEVQFDGAEVLAYESSASQDYPFQGKRYMCPGQTEYYTIGSNRRFSPMFKTSPTGEWTPSTYNVGISFYDEKASNYIRPDGDCGYSSGGSTGGGYQPIPTPPKGGAYPPTDVSVPPGYNDPGYQPPGGYGQGQPLSDADMQRLEQLSQRLMQMSTRISQYGYQNYGDAQFCADIQELKCIYAELQNLGWNDPAIAAQMGQVMPMYDQLLDTQCGGARACSGSYASGEDGTSKRVDFIDPYENFKFEAPGAIMATPPKAKPRGTLTNDNTQGATLNTGCGARRDVQYAMDPCRAEELRKKKADLPPPPPE